MKRKLILVLQMKKMKYVLFINLDDPDEDNDLSYDKDRIKTLEIAIKLNKHFENYEHRIFI